jgi:hypothetical protein
METTQIKNIFHSHRLTCINLNVRIEQKVHCKYIKLYKAYGTRHYILHIHVLYNHTDIERERKKR